MFVSLQFKLELKKKDKEKLIKLMCKQSSAIRVAHNPSKCLASSESSPPLPYPWKGLTKGPFSSEADVGGRGVG
ncbi:MAG: hypothetical protein JHC25_00910 [Thermodesulfobacterium sp.]|nr:hypothetical protein [Thermodesulfobacterium sp.]